MLQSRLAKQAFQVDEYKDIINKYKKELEDNGLLQSRLAKQAFQEETYKDL